MLVSMFELVEERIKLDFVFEKDDSCFGGWIAKLWDSIKKRRNMKK